MSGEGWLVYSRGLTRDHRPDCDFNAANCSQMNWPPNETGKSSAAEIRQSEPLPLPDRQVRFLNLSGKTSPVFLPSYSFSNRLIFVKCPVLGLRGRTRLRQLRERFKS